MENDEAGDADNAHAERGCEYGRMLWGNEETYVRPTVKMPVKTSFCGWLVLRRQRIGIGWTNDASVSLFIFCTHHTLLTKAKSTKSVAALIEPAIMKYSSTLIHLPPIEPAKLSQKSWIGVHWKMETIMQVMVRQTTN